MRTKQVRPEKLKFEYELHISKGYDKIKEAEYIHFTLITTKIFRSFIYQINVTPKMDLDNKVIEFVIEGLSAPVISIAKSGNALYEYKLYEYKYTEYDLKIVKLDVDKNLFKMKITKGGIKLTKQPVKKFLKIEV
jgi:hypothetical protein